MTTVSLPGALHREVDVDPPHSSMMERMRRPLSANERVVQSCGDGHLHLGDVGLESNMREKACVARRAGPLQRPRASLPKCPVSQDPTP